MSTTTSATSRTAAAPHWEAAWAQALSALELDVDGAEHLLALDHIADAPPDRWAPPVGLGPLPASLHERARALIGRQTEVGRRLAEAAALSRKHSSAARAMRSAAPSVPVYLDLPA